MKRPTLLQYAKRIVPALILGTTAMVMFINGFFKVIVPMDSLQTEYKSGRRCNRCNEVNFTVENTDNAKCKGDVFLLMLVVCHPNYTEARSTIRNTWASTTSYKLLNIKTLFVVGKTGVKAIDDHVKEESLKYNDILIINMQESYYKLTEKVLTALSWSLQNCPQFKYILKTDDDSFNNPGKIIDFIVSLNYPKDLVSGRCQMMKTLRDEQSKWFITESEYSGENLPVFCRGPAYVLAHKTTEALLQLSKHVTYFKLEDVYLTGFVRLEYGIQPVEMPNVYGDLSYLYLCYMDSVSSVHHVKSEDLSTIWDWLSRPVNRPYYCTYVYDHYHSTVTILILLLGILAFFYSRRCKCTGSLTKS